MPNLLKLLRPELLPPRELVEKPVNELLDLSGKCIAITGGHGPNLGQAISHRLAGVGASVAIIHRPHAVEAAEQAVSSIKDRWGVTAIAVSGDMSDWDSAHHSAVEVAERLGSLDVWVNSAGAGRDPIIDASKTEEEMGGAVDFYKYSQSLLDQTMTILLRSILYGAHAALEVMVPQGKGRIINIAASGGMPGRGARGQVPYATMKAAVMGFTEFLAADAGPSGVTVAGVAPGILLSDANMREYDIEVDEDSRVLMEQLMRRVSMGRCLWPEEAANSVAFLASDAGAYIHGTTILVAGGF